MNAKRAAPSTAAWRPDLARGAGMPRYLALADIMAEDIAAGRLADGERLPTHRALADFLGVDLTTVTRGYREAQRRGLIAATVGRGTFVRVQNAKLPRESPDEGFVPNRAMNLPPQPDAADLDGRLVSALAALQGRADILPLLTYREVAGSEEDRAAGAAWLQTVLADASADRTLVCAGAQAALLALVTTLTAPGDVILTEALAYPGFRALAAQCGVRLVGLALDEEGIRPDALRAACRDLQPKALYVVPTIHNPTTATMSVGRRQVIAGIARRHGLLIFEDDAYGFLPGKPLPPLAKFAPELTFHVSTLAKSITPGLRIAYLLAPNRDLAARLTGAVRATVMMTAPLMAAIATRWIREGTAAAILAAIRQESAARQGIAETLLPKGSFAAHPQGHHLWLAVPAAWSRAELVEYARDSGLAAVPSDAFAIDPGAPGGVRIALGAAPNRERLGEGLTRLAAALGQVPTSLSRVV